MATEQSTPIWDLGPTLQELRRRRGRFPGAFLISAIAHGSLLALAIWSVSNEVLHLPAGSSGGDAASVTVSLVGPLRSNRGASASLARPEAATQFGAMFEKFRSTDPGSGENRSKSASSTDSTAQLFKEIADAQKSADQEGKAKSQASNQGEDEGYDLWSRIRPCWRPPSSIVVTLDVGIDSQGRLAWAPKPVRSSRAPLGPRELLAESMAVQAAVRCAPYRDAAPVVGAKNFRIVFSG